MPQRLLGLAGLLAALCLVAAPAGAAPILYQYEGVGSGSVGASGFESAAFTIRARADTGGVAPWLSADLQNTHLETSIEIAGLGSFAVTTASHTWVDQRCCLGMGEDRASNWVTLDVPGFVGYGLDTDLGPIVDTTLDVAQFRDVATSGGSLAFDSIDTLTFTARVVPEPGVPALLALGLAGLALRRRRSG